MPGIDQPRRYPWNWLKRLIVRDLGKIGGNSGSVNSGIDWLYGRLAFFSSFAVEVFGVIFLDVRSPAA
jgi:hypothetical protein